MTQAICCQCSIDAVEVVLAKVPPLERGAKLLQNEIGKGRSDNWPVASF